MDLKIYLNEQSKGIEAALTRYIERNCQSRHLLEPIKYTILSGGKRMRPVLCLAAVNAVGGKPGDAMPAACAIEMVHTYSLIHDDLPALDNDDMRRGQPTCHIKFGEASAVLCGDALLTLAFEILSQASLQAPVDRCRAWLQVIHTIGKASGVSGMIEGQARDIANEGIRISRSELQAMHELKTGALIRAAVRSGAILGGGSMEQITQLDRYAKKIGLAFQVADDILNITGDPVKMGKAVGTDAERQKNTYPTLLGLENSRTFAASLIDGALQDLSIFDNNADPLKAIAKYIVERRY
jgi:geranylgeranyl diphosphate synthase type II